MKKVGGAIERINYPGVFRAFLWTAFFSENTMFRIGVREDIKDRALSFNIRLTDKVVSTLGGVLQAIQLIEVH